MSRTKVAFLHADLSAGGGAVSLLLNLCRGLKEAGHEAVVATPWATAGAIERFSPYAEVKCLEVIDHAKRYGHLMVADYYLDAVGRRLSRLVRDIDADCYIHIPGFGYRTAVDGAGRPLVYFCHGLPYTMPFMEEWYRSLPLARPLKLMLRATSPLLLSRMQRRLTRFDLVLANSRFTAEWLYLFTGIHSQVVYLPVDTERFCPQGQGGGGERYLLAIGGAAEIDSEAVAQVAATVPVVKVGAHRVAGCDNRGFVSDEELVRYYSGAVATLFPATHEPFGYIPVESMACGTPVVCYGYQGPAETVRDGETGWLVSGRRQLVDTCQEVYGRGVSDSMRQRCRQHVEERFSIPACTAALLAAVHQAQALTP